MYIAAERRQREDLRFFVVLVHDIGRIVGGRTRLQVRQCPRVHKIWYNDILYKFY